MKNRLKTALCVMIAMCSAVSCSSAPKVIDTPENSITNASSDAERKDDIVLTLAMSGDSGEMDDAIEEFNSADNGYRVEIKRFSDPNECHEEAEWELQDLEIL